MPGNSTNPGGDQSGPAQPPRPEAKDVQGAQDQMTTPATTQQQGPQTQQPAHPSKRPRPHNPDTTETSSSQHKSSRTTHQHDQQQEQPFKQQKTLPLSTQGGLLQPESQHARLGSLGGCSSSAGGAGTSIFHMQLSLAESGSLNSPFSEPTGPHSHPDALAAQPPAACSNPAHEPDMSSESQQQQQQELLQLQLPQQQQQQQQQLLGPVPAATASPSSTLNLGNQLPVGAVHAASGQGQQDQQQQQVHANPPPAPALAASGGALAAASAAMHAAVVPALQPAAAAGMAVAEAAAAGEAMVEATAAGVVFEVEAAAAAVVQPPPAAVAVVEAAAAGVAVVEAAAAAVVQPPPGAVALAAAVPAALADALPAALAAAVAPRMAPVGDVDQFVAQYAHAVGWDMAERYAAVYAGGDFLVATAAAAVNTASVGQAPDAAAAVAEAAALHIAAAQQGNPAVVAAARDAAQDAVYACDILRDDPVLFDTAQPGPNVFQVPDADVDDGDEVSDKHIASFMHPGGMVEYWGVFPTWELAAEAANAAWLAHNLGLDDEQQVGSMLQDPDGRWPVSDSVAELVGPHFLY